MFNEGNFQGETPVHESDPNTFEDRILRAACCDWVIMNQLSGLVCQDDLNKAGKHHEDFSHPALNLVFMSARSVLTVVDDATRNKSSPRDYREQVADRILAADGNKDLKKDAARKAEAMFATTEEELATCRSYVDDAAIKAWIKKRRAATIVANVAKDIGRGKHIDIDEMVRRVQVSADQLHGQDEEEEEKKAPGASTDANLRAMMSLMPKLLRDMVLESDKLGGTNAEYQMCASVAVLQSVVSASVRTVIALDGNDKAAVPALSNWLVCGGSGTGKSTAYDRAADAVKKYHTDALARWRDNKFEVKRVKDQLAKAETKYKEGNSDELRGTTLPRDTESKIDQSRELHRLDQRIRELDTKCDITLKDVTPERIGELLEETSRVNKAGWGWAFMFTDDGKLLVPSIMSDIYKKGQSSGTADLLVNHFNGGAYTKDRCGNNESHCSCGHVHFFASCTETTFVKLANDKVSQDDGILARTHLVRCETTERKTLRDRNNAYREGLNTTPAIDAWNARIAELIAWRMKRMSAEKPIVLRLSDHELRLVEDFAHKFERDPSSDPYFYRAGQHIGALIGAFHALECAGDDMSMEPSVETVFAAILMCTWLKQHRHNIREGQEESADADLCAYVDKRFNEELRTIGRGVTSCSLKAVYETSKFNGKRLTSEETERALRKLGHTVTTVGKKKTVTRRPA